MFDLSGRIALVTGGARGIGRAVSSALWQAGANVAVFGRNIEAARDFCAKLADGAAKDRKAAAYQVDVTDSEAVANAVKQLTKDFGALDIVVNNAGIRRDNLAIRLSDEDFAAVLDTNLVGAFKVSRATFAMLRKSKAGRIVNISSVIGLIGQTGQANYAAAKAGLIGLTKSLAKEFAPRRITVNAIAPGYIVTDMTRELPADQRQAFEELTPLKRPGTPEDVAPAVVYLASDEASFVTGTVLNVSGGLVI